MISILPTFQPSLLLGLITYLGLVREHIEPGKRRMWILSSLTTSIVSIVGSAQLIYWFATGDTSTSASMEYMFHLMKAYFLVDLVYNAIYHFADTDILDCWIHHTIYIVMFDQVLRQGIAGVLRPFLVLEIPAAIRAWGSLFPALRSDLAYGMTFFVFRVMWPFIAICYVDFPAWGVGCFCLAQTAHVYWFYKWVLMLLRRRAHVDRRTVINAVAEQGDAPDVRGTAAGTVAESNGAEKAEDKSDD
jgi:hypothetical protein